MFQGITKIIYYSLSPVYNVCYFTNSWFRSHQLGNHNWNMTGAAQKMAAASHAQIQLIFLMVSNVTPQPRHQFCSSTIFRGRGIHYRDFWAQTQLCKSIVLIGWDVQSTVS